MSMKFGQRLELGGRRPLFRHGSVNLLRRKQNLTVVLTLTAVVALALVWKYVVPHHAAVPESDIDHPVDPIKVEETHQTETDHQVPEAQPQLEVENKPLSEAIKEQQPQTTEPQSAVPQDAHTAGSSTEGQPQPTVADTGAAGGGDDPDERPSLESMSKYFENVLLVVSFDSNKQRLATKVVPFLKTLYGRVFQKLTFVSTGEVEGHTVDKALPRPTMQTDHGLSLNYGKLADIPNQYPGIEGILWVDCDTILNYWNFLKADKSLIWYPNLDGSKFELIKPDTVPDGWLVEQHWQAKLRNTLRSLSPDIKESLKTNLAELAKGLHIEDPGEIVAARGPFQIFYVPSTHFRGMQRLADVLHKEGLPAEVAIPTMIFGLEAPMKFDKVLEDALNLQNVFSMGQLQMCLTVYQPTVSAFWPWPYKPEASTQLLLSKMVEGDPGIKPQLDALPPVPSQDELEKQPKGPFAKVIMLISFDKPELSQATEKLYRTIYGMIFKEVIFINKQPIDPSFNKESLTLEEDMSFNYGYILLIDALMDDVEGVLFISGDYIFNHWIAEEADRNKIWLPGFLTQDSDNSMLWTGSGQWGSTHWAGAEKWKAKIERAVNTLPEDAKGVLAESFTQMEKALPTGDTGVTNVAASGPSHLFYIPSRLFPKLKQLSELLLTNIIPAEVAIPTICLAMESPDSWDTVLDTFVEIGSRDTRPPLVAAAELYDVKAAGIGPWPFELPKSQKMLFHKMSQGDSDLQIYVRNWDA